MIKLTPPSLSGVSAYVRKIGASTLPTGNTFWYEDLPQLPAILKPQQLKIETSNLGLKHELILNNKLYNTTIPHESPYYVPIVLNPGIYDYTLKVVVPGDTESTVGSFQISVKEHFWQSWIYFLEAPFQDLKTVESRFKNPLNIVLLEITFPPDILKLSNSAYVLRAFFQSIHQKGLQKSFDWFATGLLGNSAIFTSTDYTWRDTQGDYSKLNLQFTKSSISRRGFFLQKHSPDDILEANWNTALIKGQQETERILPKQTLNYLSSIRIHTNMYDGTLPLFTLLDEEYNLLYSFTRDTDSDWLLANIPSGKYYIKPRVVPGYTASVLLLPILLPPYKTEEVTIDYAQTRTRLCVKIPNGLIWVMTGRTIDGAETYINGTGPGEFDITALFLAGYIFWEINVDDSEIWVGPKHLHLLPDQNKTTCFYIYPALQPVASHVGIIHGSLYQRYNWEQEAVTFVGAEGTIIEVIPTTTLPPTTTAPTTTTIMTYAPPTFTTTPTTLTPLMTTPPPPTPAP